MALFKYGWKKDAPDYRDHLLKYEHIGIELPSSVDLRDKMPPVYDQGALGSCTAQAGAAAYAYSLKHEGQFVFQPSRLFIYYNERKLDGTVKFDAGSTIRSCMKALNKFGTANETSWPYVIEYFKKKPSKTIYKEGEKHKILEYLSLNQDPYSLKSSLAQGFPVLFGFTVYESFETKEVIKTGVMPMPSKGEKRLGGHAVLLVGYDDDKQRFIVRNSWGVNWGDDGYFYMPYDYAFNFRLSADFWTIRDV